MNKARKKRLALAGILAVIPLVLGGLVFWFFFRNIQVTVFVNDPCGACNTQEPCKPCDIVLRLEDRLKQHIEAAGIAKRAVYTIHNTYFPAGRAEYEKMLRQKGLIQDKLVQPVLFVKDEVLSGWEQLDNEATQTLRQSYYGVFSALFPQAESPSNKTAPLLTQTATAIVYFSTQGCAECGETEALLASLDSALTQSSVQTHHYKLDAETLPLFEAYCAAYGLDSGETPVPVIFTGEKALQGFASIQASLPKMVAAEECVNTPMVHEEGLSR